MRTLAFLSFVILGLFTSIEAQQFLSYPANQSDREWLGTSCANPALSADGRFTGFSTHSALVPEDPDGLEDVYVHDGRLGVQTLASPGLGGFATNGPSGIIGVSLSADGRFVAFDSQASNLVPGDTNGVTDVFVRDLTKGVTVRASVTSSGGQGTGHSLAVAISGDGRFVAFSSDADNLVAGDRNRMRDVFVRDLQTGLTTRVSVGPNGRDGNADSGRSGVSISGDGRYVAFDSEASNLIGGDTNALRDIFVRDRIKGETLLVTVGRSGPANGPSSFPALSEDGRLVAFSSWATDLVVGDTNGQADVFVRDRLLGTTERVSVSSKGVQGDLASGEHAVAISGDGMVVAYDSRAKNLVPGYLGPSDMGPRVHVHDRRTRTTSGRSFQTLGWYPRKRSGTRGIALCRSGRVTACSTYAHEGSRDSYHIVVHVMNPPPNPDPPGGVVEVVAPYVGRTATVSPNDYHVAFAWVVNGTYQILLHDRRTGVVTTVSTSSQGIPANGHCSTPRFSGDGRYVVFESWGDNLVPNDTNRTLDLFIKELPTGKTRRVSVSSTGMQADGGSSYPALSADGQIVAFRSGATNLVPNDSNRVDDIFVRELGTGTTSRVSVSSAGGQADSWSYAPCISADGRFVAFVSSATNLVLGDTNRAPDIFLHDRKTGRTYRTSVDSLGREADRSSDRPDISADGRRIVFDSEATNLVPGDTNGRADVFLHEVHTGATTRVSTDPGGGQVYKECQAPFISSDGRWVAFISESGRLAARDHNFALDVFVRDLQAGTTRCISVDSGGHEATNRSGVGFLTGYFPMGSSNSVLFDTDAGELTGGAAEAMVIRDLSSRMTVTNPARLGTKVEFRLESPSEAGKAYQAGTSFGYRPGLRHGWRTIPLNFDLLLLLSLSSPSIWVNFSGRLDASGTAQAFLWLPNDPRLAGVNFYAAFVVLDPSAPDGVSGISNAAHVQAADR